MPRREFPRKVRQAARAKSANYRWLESLVAAPWPEACINWPHAKRENGYGTIFKDGVRTTSHRVVCTIAHGEPIDRRLEAAHSCGNRLCVNPGHLSWKTHQANIDDKRLHGTHLLGERVKHSKLSSADVRYIRASSETMAALAEKYGVCPQTVHEAKTRKTWRHLP